MKKISGKWRIAEMELWEQKDVELLGPGFIQFDSKDSGQFRFIAVEGAMDCRHSLKNGRPYVEFTWDGNDEYDPVSGKGWAELEDNGELRGRIYFHQGDNSEFVALISAGEENRMKRA